MRLSLTHHPDGVAVEPPHRILYDVAAGQAHAAPARASGDAYVWALGEDAPQDALLSVEVDLGPSTDWLMRADRIDFVPGGVAHRHTHPGPGIRVLLFGAITIDSEGETTTYGPGEPWFERGPDPVLATTSEDEPSAFARVLLLPVEWAGKRTIRYVDPADADKPKTQKPTVFLEHPVTR